MAATFKLSDKAKASVAKHLQKAEIRKLPPVARAAQRRANETGKSVGYIGGSGHNSSSATYKGTVQPMASQPKFASAKVAATAPTAPTQKASATAQSFSNTGSGFGIGALERARKAGLTDNQIKAQVVGSGLTIGGDVQKLLGIGANGLPSHVKSSYVDAGSGASYDTRGVATDTHGTVYAAGPMTGEAVRDFLAGKPESSWLLPASVGKSGSPYQAPAGVNYVQPALGVGGQPDRQLQQSVQEQTTSQQQPVQQQVAPQPTFSPGGVGANVGNNALGFRRKKSSGRIAGLTSKGVGQFRITGQSRQSAGLNIGT
jgi:hypothetical protein